VLIVEHVAGIADCAHARACAHADKTGIEYFLQGIARRLHFRIGQKRLLIAIHVVDQFIDSHVRGFRADFFRAFGQGAHENFPGRRPAAFEEVVERKFLKPRLNSAGDCAHTCRLNLVVACVAGFVVTGRARSSGGIEQTGSGAAGQSRYGEAGYLLKQGRADIDHEPLVRVLFRDTRQRISLFLSVHRRHLGTDLCQFRFVEHITDSSYQAAH